MRGRRSRGLGRARLELLLKPRRPRSAPHTGERGEGVSVLPPFRPSALREEYRPSARGVATMICAIWPAARWSGSERRETSTVKSAVGVSPPARPIRSRSVIPSKRGRVPGSRTAPWTSTWCTGSNRVRYQPNRFVWVAWDVGRNFVRNAGHTGNLRPLGA